MSKASAIESIKVWRPLIISPQGLYLLLILRFSASLSSTDLKIKSRSVKHRDLSMCGWWGTATLAHIGKTLLLGELDKVADAMSSQKWRLWACLGGAINRNHNRNSLIQWCSARSESDRPTEYFQGDTSGAIFKNCFRVSIRPRSALSLWNFNLLYR